MPKSLILTYGRFFKSQGINLSSELHKLVFDQIYNTIIFQNKTVEPGGIYFA